MHPITSDVVRVARQELAEARSATDEQIGPVTAAVDTIADVPGDPFLVRPESWWSFFEPDRARARPPGTGGGAQLHGLVGALFPQLVDGLGRVGAFVTSHVPTIELSSIIGNVLTQIRAASGRVEPREPSEARRPDRRKPSA